VDYIAKSAAFWYESELRSRYKVQINDLHVPSELMLMILPCYTAKAPGGRCLASQQVNEQKSDRLTTPQGVAQF